MSIANNKKVKFDGARCPFSTFLRLQGDHNCACAQKWCHFSFFFQELSNKKKIKALRPKMTKIASRGGGSCLKDLECEVIGWLHLLFVPGTQINFPPKSHMRFLRRRFCKQDHSILFCWSVKDNGLSVGSGLVLGKFCTFWQRCLANAFDSRLQGD